jgi:myo-inositol-1-phosphate synthase
MAERYRLKNKHISKENVLRGQNEVRGESVAGMTMYAGPSLTVTQKPGGVYQGSDNKIANLDIVAYGFCHAKYELTCRMSVQDSPNSGGIVLDAVRFCKVAAEMGIVGYLRGPSAWTQKTPCVQLKTTDAKFECDALARRVLTPMTTVQLKQNIDLSTLSYSTQKSTSDYEK